MSPAAWAKVAAELMSEAAGEFGNHGCNDLNLDELGLTRDEQIALVTFMHEQNGDPEEIPAAIEWLPNASDFCVMYACAAWLRGLAEPPKDPPSPGRSTTWAKDDALELAA